MTVHPDTSGGGGVGRLSMAILGVSPSSIVVHDEHQKGGAVTGHASRRLPHARFEFGRCPSSARRRPVRGSSQVTTRIGHPIHVAKLTLGLVQSFAGQLLSQKIADLDHSTNCLSQKPSLDVSKTIEKAFGDGRISFGGQRIVFLG